MSLPIELDMLIEWQAFSEGDQDADSSRTERILWLDASRQTVVTIDIFGPGAMPTLRLYDDLTRALTAGAARILATDPYAELRRRDEDITTCQRQRRDEAWRVIEPLIAGHNAELLLRPDRRGPLITRTLPVIDRLLESGRERTSVFASIDEKTYDRELGEKEREERFKVGVFLKAYVDERLKDPETRALNNSAPFRAAHKQITEARTPVELNRVAEEFLRENLRQSAALRLHHADPAARPKPETAPLNARERNLLFFGRAPEHHTPEMRELRHYWGLSRAERAARAEALRQGQLSPSLTLEQMLAELEMRRSAQAIRHYQAAILNEEMRNPGKLDLRPMFERLPPHERAFLIERIEAKKQPLTRPQLPAHDPAGALSSRRTMPSAAKPFASIPRESNSYREYMASMGSIELRLLNEAVRRRQKDSGHIVISKEEHSLSITEARALLPREEQVRIREQARNLAWEQIAPPEVFAPQPEPAARRLSDTVAHLQEETQQRARLAHQALDEFVREKAGFSGRNDPHSADALSKLEPADAQRMRALEDYAARMREELYRGFESLDALRRELEKPRGHDDAGRY